MINKSQVMQRGWALFRETYRYPAIPFRSIGRHCFVSCLRKAWAEAKETARIAAIPAEVKAARVAELRHALELVPYMASFPQMVARRSAIHSEIARLSA